MNDNIKLEIVDLCKEYENKTALSYLNFEVFSGEFLSVLGPSGCGKSTLLRILIGLLMPDNGRIMKDGKDITKQHPSRRQMGIVFQNYALFENMTVLENVEYVLKLQKETKAAAREKAAAMIEKMKLTEYSKKRPSQLSGGQQQRVAIARTLVLNPEIILFDEPMSALDATTRIALRKELKQIRQEYGTTMIYITHDQEEAFAMSDRIMVMKEASIVQIDTPKNIISNPADSYVKEFVVDNIRAKIDSLIQFAG